jgi:hypothetical protein
MDALVKAALEKVNEAVASVNWVVWEEAKSGSYADSTTNPLQDSIARAVHSVDALKSALKALIPGQGAKTLTPAELAENHKAMAKYLRDNPTQLGTCKPLPTV